VLAFSITYIRRRSLLTQPCYHHHQGLDKLCYKCAREVKAVLRPSKQPPTRAADLPLTAPSAYMQDR
jgi:hypothetical protein